MRYPYPVPKVGDVITPVHRPYVSPDDPSWNDLDELLKCVGVFYWSKRERFLDLEDACDYVKTIHEEYALMSEGVQSLGGDFPEDVRGLPRYEFDLWNRTCTADYVAVDWEDEDHGDGVVWGHILIDASPMEEWIEGLEPPDVHAVPVWGNRLDDPEMMKKWLERKKRTIDEVAALLGVPPVTDLRAEGLSVWFQDLKLRSLRLDHWKH